MRPRRWIALAVVVVVAAVSVAVAMATVIPTVLADTTDVRLRVVRSSFEPSPDQPVFSSGWHTHPGPVIVQVQTGQLFVTDHRCDKTVLRPGETLVEVPVLPLLVTATRSATWTTTFIVPADAPLATPVDGPCEGTRRG